MVILSDLIQREAFAREILLSSIRKSVMWESGIITPDTKLTELMNANIGSVFQFDYFLDLADNEGRISDDSSNQAGTDGIGTGTDQAVGNYRNRSWGERNITASLSATGSALTTIAGRIGAYWGRQMDFSTIAIVNGIIADNMANDGSDMVNNQTGVSIDVEMVLDTIQTAGDFGDVFKTMICHSGIRTSLKKKGVTDKVYDLQGNYLYEALSGLRLVITDSVPTGTAIPGGAVGDYLSYILGGSMIGYGEGTPKMPLETFWDAKAGNGAGEESMWSRKNFSLHPYGFSFTNALVSSTSPTNAEFALAENWNRNVDRKRVPFAGLISTI
jgi:hypothetical protein